MKKKIDLQKWVKLDVKNKSKVLLSENILIFSTKVKISKSNKPFSLL
jgi:hypothetical protein